MPLLWMMHSASRAAALPPLAQTFQNTSMFALCRAIC